MTAEAIIRAASISADVVLAWISPLNSHQRSSLEVDAAVAGVRTAEGQRAGFCLDQLGAAAQHAGAGIGDAAVLLELDLGAGCGAL